MTPSPNLHTPSRRQWISGATLGFVTLHLVGTDSILNATSSRSKKAVRAYVGTFSSPLKDVLPTQVDLPPGNGRGIHIFEMDSESGELKEIGIAELGTSPSCLVLDKAESFLYSANETDRVGAENHGTVSAWKIDSESGLLSLVNTVSSGGAGPTYVSLHPNGKFLLVANYFGGSIAVHPILPDGAVGEAVDVQTDEGNIGPTRAKHAPKGSFAISGHDRTHAHMIETDSTGKWVIHCDLGQDRIYIWRFDAANGKLTPAPKPFIALPPGDGPRHFQFHPNGKWFYSIQEEGSTVVLFEFDTTTGGLDERQTISTLPPKFEGSNFCSEILVSQDGRFVYAGNRLHDSIAIFRIGEVGKLTYVGEVWTQGNYPRSFTIDPSGNWLVCCNQRSDNLAIFRIDRTSGELEFSGKFAAVGNPSVVRFSST
ncbi:lactonase family protein [Pirellulaceae bacterium SH467]